MCVKKKMVPLKSSDFSSCSRPKYGQSRGVSFTFRHAPWYFQATRETIVYWDNQKYMCVTAYSVNIEYVMIFELFHMNPGAEGLGFHRHSFRLLNGPQFWLVIPCHTTRRCCLFCCLQDMGRFLIFCEFIPQARQFLRCRS